MWVLQWVETQNTTSTPDFNGSEHGRLWDVLSPDVKAHQATCLPSCFLHVTPDLGRRQRHITPSPFYCCSCAMSEPSLQQIRPLIFPILDYLQNGLLLKVFTSFVYFKILHLLPPKELCVVPHTLAGIVDIMIVVMSWLHNHYLVDHDTHVCHALVSGTSSWQYIHPLGYRIPHFRVQCYSHHT